MRSRLAIIAMLVFGMVLSTGGGALAVSGFTSQQDNAAQGQYGGGNVGGQDNGGKKGGGKKGGEVLGEDESGGPAENNGGPAGEEEASQPARQVEAGAQGSGGEELPFTGFAAIPILLGGVALLTSGLVLRKRAADERE